MQTRLGTGIVWTCPTIRTTPGRFSLNSGPLVMNAIQLAGPLLAIVLLQLWGRLRSIVEPVVGLFR